MNCCALNNYKLSKLEILKSLIVSEYGLRHLAQAKTGPNKWGHRIIAVIELCPVIGLIATLIEALAAKYILLPPPALESPLKIETLFSGSQRGCNGLVPAPKVQSVCKRLNQNCSLRIRFNKDKITSELSGGTCTAMSLEFLDTYFKEKTRRRGNLSDTLVGRLMLIGPKFATSSEEMRIRQAAYNTIEIERLDLNTLSDYSRNKIQSMASYYSFQIDYSSPEIDTIDSNNENELLNQVENLPEGAFLMRILKPANNEKLEEAGHSLVYIKDPQSALFYDPNNGLSHLPLSEAPSFLLQKIRLCYDHFRISKLRFYRLQSAV
jgi:hypothetical protein